MSKPKILHINTYQQGGAGKAAMRLHKTLRKYGYDSKFLFFDRCTVTDTEFQFGKRRNWFIFILRVLKKLGLPLDTEQRNDYTIQKFKYDIELFTFANTAYTNLHEHPLVKESDIIHLHWVSDFVDFKSFFKNIDKPVVWTQHDMNGFLGGFHYNNDVKLFGERMKHLNDKQIMIKKDALHQLDTDKLTIITPSSWLYHLSESSDILGRFPHYLISYGLDTNTFKVKERSNSQKDGKINVLFVAENLDNYRKGFDIALEVLKDKEVADKCHFMAVGNVDKKARLPFITYFGSISSEERLSEIYNEADIFLLPSREDNLPNTMLESLCCGTPVVGFDVGGLPDAVTNGENGYLSEDMSHAGLKQALLTCIANIQSLNRKNISDAAHAKYAENIQADKVISIYTHMLKPAREEVIL